MTPADVKTLLFISSTDKDYSYGFLFHCAKYWADQGVKVLYITHEPLDHLPRSVGIPNDGQNLENLYLIRFLYLPTASDLLKECYSIHQHPNPVSAIIVQELENYCVHDDQVDHDHVSLVCASLLHAAAVCSRKSSKTSFLAVGFNSKKSVIDRTVCKNFFHNVWEIRANVDEIGNGKGERKKTGGGDDDDDDDEKYVTLSKMSRISKTGDPKLFAFRENRERSFLDLETVLEAIVRTAK